MSEQSYLNEARFHASRDQYGKAIDVLEQAVAIGDESCEICKELARLSLQVNELRAFANWCHEAMRINPSDPEPHLMMGRVLVGSQRWGEAVETLEQGLRLGGLSRSDHAELEQLLAQARQAYGAYKSRHPGASNI